MSQFRRLSRIVFLSGIVAGLVLFLLQHVFLVPRIQQAEVYEDAGHHATASMQHEDDEGWKPSEGMERTLYSGLGSIFTGIGFAAVFVAVIALSNVRLTPWRGVWWAVAAFASVVVAPGLGLPAEPPGVPVADLYPRQVCWISAVILTAAGLYLLARCSRPYQKILGVICLVVPHLIGAPQAEGTSLVPEQLIREFRNYSVAVNAIFWLVMGGACGFLFKREADRLAANAGLH